MAAETTVPFEKVILRSLATPGFTIEVGPRIINSCSILKNVTQHTDNSDTIEVEMNQKQLEKFVELHNHFETPDSPKDPEFTKSIFDSFTDDEFKDFTFKADFLDSQRFLEAAGDYVLNKINDLEVPEIQKYLELIDDFTPDERRALEESPLEFFSGIKFKDEMEKENEDQGIDEINFDNL